MLDFTRMYFAKEVIELQHNNILAEIKAHRLGQQVKLINLELKSLGTKPTLKRFTLLNRVGQSFSGKFQDDKI